MRKILKFKAVVIAMLIVASLFGIVSCRNYIFIPIYDAGPDEGGGDDVIEPEPSLPVVVGVAWDYGESDTKLYRLTTPDAAAVDGMKTMDDPLDLVTVDITVEPVPYHEGQEGSSPFDTLEPWSGLVLVAMSEGGIIEDTIEEGEAISSFVSDNPDTDIMVTLPDMYYRVVDDSAGSIRYYYVGNVSFAGAELHPSSSEYIARYDAMNPEKSSSWSTENDKIYSRPSEDVAIGMTPYEANLMIRNKGKGYHGMMLSELSYIQLMYLVEYADMDFERRVGVGQLVTAGQPDSGGTDSLPYHTGSNGTGSNTAYDVQYRYIEGLFGLDTTGDYINGLVAYNTSMYFTDDIDMAVFDPSEITASSDLASWKSLGMHPGDGYVTKLQYIEDFPWLIGIPEATDSASGNAAFTTDKIVTPPAVAVLSFFNLARSGQAYDTGAWYIGPIRTDRITDSTKNTCRICYSD